MPVENNELSICVAKSQHFRSDDHAIFGNISSQRLEFEPETKKIQTNFVVTGFNQNNQRTPKCWEHKLTSGIFGLYATTSMLASFSQNRTEPI